MYAFIYRIERIDGDVDTLANFFSQIIIYLVGNALLLLGVVALLFHIDWRLGTTMMLFICLAMGILVVIHKDAVPRWVANRQKSAEFFGFLGEHLGNFDNSGRMNLCKQAGSGSLLTHPACDASAGGV